VGGNSSISDDDYIEGAPELIVEVAASSASYEVNDKLNAYRRNGVREYIVWQQYDDRVDWFQLHEGRYIAFVPDKRKIIRSEVFPGLWLSIDALRQGNRTELMAIVRKGLQSPEHKAFVDRLG